MSPRLAGLRGLIGALLVAVVSTGCFASHGAGRSPGARPGEEPGEEEDGGLDGGAAGPDLGRREDLGVDQGPPLPDLGDDACVARALDFAFSQRINGGVPTNVGFDLEVGFGGLDTCYCGEELECVGALDAAARRIDLSSVMCSRVLCDACFPFVLGSCPIPGLREGTYEVHVNGAYAFPLEASDRVLSITPAQRALARPRGDPFGCPGTSMTRPPPAVREVCMPERVQGSGPTNVRVVADCLLCRESLGPCTVTRQADSIVIDLAMSDSTCSGGCATECERREMACVLPPLERGTYGVRVEGWSAGWTLEVDPDQPDAPRQTCVVSTRG
ncbi:MAG: hypothetical protein ACFCGT_08355 [Sandaracinaceae bacterium]